MGRPYGVCSYHKQRKTDTMNTATTPLMFRQFQPDTAFRNTVACAVRAGDTITYTHKGTIIIMHVELAAHDSDTSLLYGTTRETRKGKVIRKGKAATRRTLPSDFTVRLLGSHNRTR